MDLDGVRGDLRSHLAAEKEGGGRLAVKIGTFSADLVRQRVAVGRGAVSHPFGGHVARVHIGQFSLDKLEGGDRLSELHPLPGVTEAQFQTSPLRTKAATAQGDPLGAEAVGQDRPAPVQAADEVFFGQFHVFEGDQGRRRAPHTPFLDLFPVESLHAVGEEIEGGNPVRPAGRAGFCVEEHEIGDGSVGDEGFAPVDPIAVSDLFGAGRHPHCIGAGVGLGDAQAADILPAAGLREDCRLLLFRGVPPEVVKTECLACSHGHGEGVAHSSDGFIDEKGLHITEPRAAIFLLKDNAVDAEIAQLTEEFGGHLIFLIERLHLRLQPVGCPAPDAFFNQFLFQRKFEIKRHGDFLSRLVPSWPICSRRRRSCPFSRHTGPAAILQTDLRR